MHSPYNTAQILLHTSEIRQVPDNQEVFVDQDSEASLILELLELERDKEGNQVGG